MKIPKDKLQGSSHYITILGTQVSLPKALLKRVSFSRVGYVSSTVEGIIPFRGWGRRLVEPKSFSPQKSEEWRQLLQSNAMDAEMESWQVDIYSDVNLGRC